MRFLPFKMVINVEMHLAVGTFLTTNTPMITAIDANGQAMHIITPDKKGVGSSPGSAFSGSLSDDTLMFQFTAGGVTYDGTLPIIGTAPWFVQC